MTAVRSTLTRDPWQPARDGALVATLEALPLFAQLGRREVRKIVRRAELADFERGEIVLRCDAPPDFFHVVLRGRAELREDGRTRRLRPGDYFGEAVLLDAPSPPATIVSTDELQVLRLPSGLFVQLVRRNPSMSFVMLRHLGQQVRQANPRAVFRAA